MPLNGRQSLRVSIWNFVGATLKNVRSESMPNDLNCYAVHLCELNNYLLVVIWFFRHLECE